MISKRFVTGAVVVGVLVLAGGTTMAEVSRAGSPSNALSIARESDSGQFSIILAQLEQYDQSSLLIADVNEESLLASILDQYIEDDPNEPEKYVPLGGGGGGSVGSSSGLFASNPHAGSSGGGGLMSTPSVPAAPQSTGPAAYADTLFAAAPFPVDDGTGETVEPIPYPTDGTTTVPEPATIAMLGLGSLALLRKRNT